METVHRLSQNLIKRVSLDFKRSAIHRIDWSLPLIEIRGSRGVGKTTMLLQQAHELSSKGIKVLYASLDTPYFFSHGLFEFAESALLYGFEVLFLDEVHRYPSKHKSSDWSLEIKNIHDAFPELKLVYSGSSILHLFQGKGDLSRRKASYILPGLSFREYLIYNNILNENPYYSLDDILSHHQVIAEELITRFKPLPHFKNYLRHGYYPFFKGNEEVYIQQLQDVVSIVIDADLPQALPISHQAKEQLKRLLGAVSTTVPYTPNMQKLAELVQITDYRTLLKYLNMLDEAQLIRLLRSDSKGNKIFQKPDKIYLNNTNLSHALGLAQSDIGTERETFFFNQVSCVASVRYPKNGDFIVDNKLHFEVGGKHKNHEQIKGIAHSYVASDDIEVGFTNRVPLWLFGFLY